MKKPSQHAGLDNDFKVPGWFRKLWEGNLFGKRKDKLIMRILKLGGKGFLMSDCGLHLERDMIKALPAPTMNKLRAVLLKTEAEWEDTQRSMALAESMQAHREDYDVEEKVLIDTEHTYCSMQTWTPKTSKRKGISH